MAIPDFQTLMLPVLKFIASKDISASKEVIAEMVQQFNLSDEDAEKLLPSKTQRVIDNRVYWAQVYLQKAGLVMRPARGRYQVTDEGTAVLARNPSRIDIKFLKQFPAFQKFQALSKGDSITETLDTSASSSEATDPLEELEASYERMKASVCEELLSHARELDPTAFERLVIELLRKMGYGIDPNSVVHRGRTGDGGIDGEISQDRLGLEMIYIQAKRYQEGASVGRPAIQQFVGSLNERKAQKGLFITTSHFSADAHEYVNRIDVRIILIDGEQLAKLMFEFDLGVTTEQKYEVKKVDQDFFEN
ncbi:MAG: restriction endonuclease [Bdellovibrionaceae bacterium]|nr:restriction endonuclease [Pseudobdellovibrionaceae bacterium]